MPNSNLRAKVEQEKLIREPKIPYSTLHSTQFFEFAVAIAREGTVGDTIHLSSALFQLFVSDDVVDVPVNINFEDPIMAL